jgi:UDP-N-acetylglucosamine--N-acetylmuramyl-(pentapeptide) pyrophosphoryl-undecaprenol N-acetylglucosamine transferase
MKTEDQNSLHIAIACGGTGGHLFPGLAVAQSLLRNGARVTLMISPKEVDQQAVRNNVGMEIVTLPAAGLQRGKLFSFIEGVWKSYQVSSRFFQRHPPSAVLGMGGFTSAGPILAGRKRGARIFLHESNTIPGRANVWLSFLAHGCFVGFAETAARLHGKVARVTGTPVRPQFQPLNAGDARRALNLDPMKPVLLVMGGSQGASGINRLIMEAAPAIAAAAPGVQWLHLSGAGDFEQVKSCYSRLGVKAIVHSFFDGMELALAAASVAVSRAGASSLAEIAAASLPAILIPYPSATGNHQFFNARAFEQTGAALLLEEHSASPEKLAKRIVDLLGSADARAKLQTALAAWRTPGCAEQIAAEILAQVSEPKPTTQTGTPCNAIMSGPPPTLRPAQPTHG